MKISFFSDLFNLLFPRSCTICGARLAVCEKVFCTSCNFFLPRTHYHTDPYHNEMAKTFWGRLPIERCSALCFFEPGSKVAYPIYAVKYHDKPNIGFLLGKLMASEVSESNFFQDIDCIIPIPLEHSRQVHRGYNQSEEIAKGIAHITHLPVLNKVVKRIHFAESQTSKDRWQRNDNVKDAFQLTDSSAIAHKHILIVDDVVTTGATICACATALMNAPDIRISVLSYGFVKH